MTTDFETRVALGSEFQRAGKHDEAMAHFRQLVEDYPDDPRAYYEYAGSFDSAGHEAEALLLYHKSLEMGLSGDYLPKIYLQMASSLRNMGQYEAAVKMLEEASEHYPERPSLKLFLALALESAGRDHDALTALFELAIAHVDTADMQRYARSIRGYVDARR